MIGGAPASARDDHAATAAPAKGSASVLRVSLVICAVVLVVLVLQQLRSVFAPLTFALLVIAIVWPVQRRLQQWMPTLVALAFSTLLTFLFVTIFATLCAWAFTRVTRDLVGQAGQLQMLYEQAAAWLEQYGIVAAGLWAEHLNMGSLDRILQQLLGTINSTLTFSLVVIVYVVLGLLEVEHAGSRLRDMSNREVGRALLDGIAETADKLRRYMGVRTLMSAATGGLVWIFASVTGLPHAMEWGAIAFALNYIPFIGPFIATIFPTLFAVTQFQSWEMVAIVFICLNLIQFLVGSYLEPRIAGNALSISPFMVLFSVFFWTALWGMAGAFIGVPITVALLTICGRFRASRWVAEVFGISPGEADRVAG